jgi:hypothetical protein
MTTSDFRRGRVRLVGLELRSGDMATPGVSVGEWLGEGVRWTEE